MSEPATRKQLLELQKQVDELRKWFDDEKKKMNQWFLDEKKSVHGELDKLFKGLEAHRKWMDEEMKWTRSALDAAKKP